MFLSNYIYQSLTILHISLPYPITTHKDELILFTALMFDYIWFTGYHLFVVR